MSTTALWGDEFGSIGTFSSRGWKRVVTDYRAPKNHVFFNLANSILPGKASYAPPRARMLSFLAVLATFALAVGFFLRARLDLGIPVFLGLWALNGETLHLALQARGYGMLGFFAMTTVVLLGGFLARRDWRYLAGAAFLSALGIYTVPAYVFFCTPVLAMALCLMPAWRNFAICAAGGALTLILYAPLIGQLAKSAGSFSEKYPGETTFSSWLGIEGFLRAHMYASLHPALGWFALLIAAGLILLGIKDRLSAKILALLAAGITGFFLAALIIQSVPARVASFMAVPCALALAFAVSASLRLWKPGSAFLVPFFSLAVAGMGIFHSWQFSFVPNEDWFRAVRVAEMLSGPSTEVLLDESAKNMRRYLPDKRVVPMGAPEAPWRKEDLYVDTATTWLNERDRKPLPAGLKQHALDISIAGRHQIIHVSFFARDIVSADGLLAKVPPQPRPVALIISASAETCGLLAVEQLDGPQWRNVPGIVRTSNAVLVPVAPAKVGQQFRVRFPGGGARDATLRVVSLPGSKRD